MAIQAQIYSGFAMGIPQDLLMENAFGLNSPCFVQKPQHEQQHPMQRIPFVPKYNISDNQQQLIDFSQSISGHVENQRIEIDLFIKSQNERLRMALQEQKKHQIALLMKKYEPKIQFLIKQKEEQISNASSRTIELQNFLSRMEIESQTWQRVARENEAMAASLNDTIERLRETAGNSAVDAESCCMEDEEWERERRKMKCRNCEFREACVVMLPCRHLCSCRECEKLLDYCPVCTMVKEASVEALVS